MSDETTNEETEPVQDEAPEAEAAAPDAQAPGADDAPAAEPAEVLHPKEARKRSRSRHAGTARSARTIEERAAERAAVRAAKAKERRASRAKAKAKASARPGEAAAPTAPAERAAGRPKQRQGIVISDKPDKTIVVRVDTARRHRRYEKIVRSSSTLHAHDEGNDAHAGDTVTVIECRPMSRTKRWRLVEVLERAK